eukprot:gene30876-38702_t
MSYSDLVVNDTYYALVVSGFQSSVAASAGVASSQVALVSVYAGSVAVDATVSYIDLDMAAGSTPDAFSTTLGDSSLLADVFANSEVLGAYASSASAGSVVTTVVTPSPAAGTQSLISAEGAGHVGSAEAASNSGNNTAGSDASAPGDTGGTGVTVDNTGGSDAPIITCPTGSDMI